MDYIYYRNLTKDHKNYRSYDNGTGDHGCYYERGSSWFVVTCVIVAVGLPLTLAAIYAVFTLVQKDSVAPVYIINLLIADVIQLCSMIVLLTNNKSDNSCEVFVHIYNLCMMASVGFMVCVSLERYLVIAWPLWYRFRRTIKISLMVCFVVWAFPLVWILLTHFWTAFDRISVTALGVFLLLPFPLLIFFLAGTLRALSTAISVPPDEKRRIVALLVLVLLVYVLLFLPDIIMFLVEQTDTPLSNLSSVIVKFSPLADSFLYVLLRKGAADKLLASLCWRMDNSDMSRSAELT